MGLENIPGGKRLWGIALALLASASFGLLPLFTIPLLHAGIFVSSVMVYRFGVASIVMWLILLIKGESIRVGMRDMIKLFALSLQSFLMVICYTQALTYMASGPVTTLQFLYPVMVMLNMILFFHEKFHWYMGVAVALAFAGVAILSFEPGSNSDASANGSIFWGVTLSLAAGLWSALYYVGILIANMPHVDGLVMTFYILVFGTIFCLISAVWTDSLQWIGSWREIGIIFLLAVVTAVLANLALIVAIELVGPTMSSIMGVMEPLTAVFVGIFVFGELFSLQLAAGVLLIMVSVIVVIAGPHLLKAK